MCMASLNESSLRLHCPRNGTSLRFQGSGFLSQDGKNLYPLDDGIIDLRCNRRDYYFNPVPRGAMGTLTVEAKHLPWSRTIRRFMGHVNCNPDWLDNLVADG